MNYELTQISRICNVSCILYFSIRWVEKVGRIGMTVDSVKVSEYFAIVIIFFINKIDICFLNLYYFS